MMRSEEEYVCPRCGTVIEITISERDDDGVITTTTRSTEGCEHIRPSGTRPTGDEAREMRARDPLGDWYPIGSLPGDAEHVAELVRSHLARVNRDIAEIVLKFTRATVPATGAELAMRRALIEIAEYVAPAGHFKEVQPIRDILARLKRDGVEL